MMRSALAIPGLLFTLGAFVLLLLTSISTPVVKSLWFLRILPGSASTSSAVGLAGHINLGTYGYCTSGFSLSNPLAAAVALTTGSCSSRRIGYKLPVDIFAALSVASGLGANVDNTRAANALNEKLSRALILQPIACGFAGLALILALLALFLKSRIFAALTFLLTFLAMIVAWVAWAIAMALFATTRNRIRSATSGALTARLGSCIWLGLAAAILLTLATLFSCLAFLALRKSNKKTEVVHKPERTEMAYVDHTARATPVVVARPPSPQYVAPPVTVPTPRAAPVTVPTPRAAPVSAPAPRATPVIITRPITPPPVMETRRVVAEDTTSRIIAPLIATRPVSPPLVLDRSAAATGVARSESGHMIAPFTVAPPVVDGTRYEGTQYDAGVRGTRYNDGNQYAETTRYDEGVRGGRYNQGNQYNETARYNEAPRNDRTRL